MKFSYVQNLVRQFLESTRESQSKSRDAENLALTCLKQMVELGHVGDDRELVRHVAVHHVLVHVGHGSAVVLEYIRGAWVSSGYRWWGQLYIYRDL
jgi:hypothetical protein